MKCWSIFLFISFFRITATAGEAPACHEELTETPPAYLVDPSRESEEVWGKRELYYVGGKGKTSTEKFASASGNREIARGSRVRPTGEISEDESTLVQVEVLSAANRSLIPVKGDWQLAKAGEKGFIPRNAIRPFSSDQVFWVKKNTKLMSLQSLNLADLAPGTVLRPSTREGKYRIMSCPALSYVFETVLANGAEGDQVLYSARPCEPLVPILESHANDMNRFANFLSSYYSEKTEESFQHIEVNEWGNVRLPVSKKGNGFIHFLGGDVAGSDDWGNPDSVCELLRLSRRWQAHCQAGDRCTLQYGDLAFATPGLTETKRDPLGHKFHSQGFCVDMRPLRTDNKWLGAIHNRPETNYDRDLTADFIAFALAQGASPIYFNDPKLVADKKIGEGRSCNEEDHTQDIGKKLLACPGHDDHIHFCFYPSRSKGCQLN